METIWNYEEIRKTYSSEVINRIRILSKWLIVKVNDELGSYWRLEGLVIAGDQDDEDLAKLKAVVSSFAGRYTRTSPIARVLDSHLCLTQGGTLYILPIGDHNTFVYPNNRSTIHLHNII